MARSFLPETLKRRVPVVIAVVVTLLFAWLAYVRSDLTDDSYLTTLERNWTDSKFRMRGPQLPGGEVVIVGIDDRTLRELGSFRTFTRNNWTTLVDKLAAAKPKAIGFDITFPEADTSHPDNDRLFAEAVERAGNVVLGVYMDLLATSGMSRREAPPMSAELMDLVAQKQVFPVEDYPQGTGRATSTFLKGKAIEWNIPELTTAAASFGFVNFHPDARGFLRHQPQFIDYQDRLYPSLDVQLMRRYFETESPIVKFNKDNPELIEDVRVGNLTIPVDKFGRLIVNFNGAKGTHDTVSMIDVLNGPILTERLQGKIVLVGALAVGLFDTQPTPFDETLPGVELHANVIDNIVRQRFIYRSAALQFLDVALILVFGTLLAVFLPRMDAGRSVGYTVLLIIGFTVLNILSFIMLSWLMSFVYPGLALIAISSSMISYKYLTEEREKKRTRSTFQYYLDENVINQIMNQPDLLKLGGEKRELSVLFSDIRGFTSFSEKMAPTEVVHFLNQYFDKMSGLIFQYKGTLDKLIGDAVMCFWGHPVEAKDHAVRATICALEMIQAVEDLRPVLILPGGAKFEIGIGVNTGPMVVGNMGSHQRFSYTVMGDNVNLGSRLEALNKYYGTRILISDATYEECRHLIFCRQLDTIQVKGKSDAVTIYEPLGLRRLHEDRRNFDRREVNPPSKLKKKFMLLRHGERRVTERRLGSARLLVKPEQEEITAIYAHALALYRRGEFDAAESGFDHVLALSPSDGPSRLMKSRITKYRSEYVGVQAKFDPVYRFDEK